MSSGLYHGNSPLRGVKGTPVENPPRPTDTPPGEGKIQLSGLTRIDVNPQVENPTPRCFVETS